MSEGFDNFEPDDRRLSELESSRVLAKRLLAVLSEMLLELITAIDLYLIGVVLLIFGFGIYELFISKIDIARADEVGAARNPVLVYVNESSD